MVTKAIKRLGFRFSKAAKTNNKTMRLYQEDVDALKVIAEHIERTQKNTVVDNVLFTKLYIYLFGEFIRHYECFVGDPIPQKELHRILDTDIKVLITDFQDKVNHQKLNAIKNTEDLENYRPTTFQECVDNLEILSTEAINEFSPKHLNRV